MVADGRISIHATARLDGPLLEIMHSEVYGLAYYGFLFTILRSSLLCFKDGFFWVRLQQPEYEFHPIAACKLLPRTTQGSDTVLPLQAPASQTPATSQTSAQATLMTTLILTTWRTWRCLTWAAARCSRHDQALTRVPGQPSTLPSLQSRKTVGHLKGGGPPLTG